jgi:acetyl-CoA carboxylase biotin carboxyl carrier protein
VSLTAADVAEIMKILEGSGFDEVLLEIDGLKLSMKRGAGATDASAGAPMTTAAVNTHGTAATAAATAGAQTSAAAAPPTAARSAAPGKPAASTDPTVQNVTSPLLGTCYLAPKPGAPPFVEVGTDVSEQTVVAIVEVMKLMNTVRAGVTGTVSEILMRDGTLVEYGETLLRIKKAG